MSDQNTGFSSLTSSVLCLFHENLLYSVFVLFGSLPCRFHHIGLWVQYQCHAGTEISIKTPPTVDLITAVLRQSMSWFLIHNHHSPLGNDNSNGRTA